MTTLDQQISIMRIEDQTARVERLKAAYFKASDRLEAALAAVERAKDAKGRALNTYRTEDAKLQAMQPDDSGENIWPTAYEERFNGI